jgi:large subunit ribosomal protein L24e
VLQMVERKICSFCGGDIEPGTGKMYIKKDGTTFSFCSNKCKKNIIVLKRNPRLAKWTLNFVKVSAEVESEEKKQQKVKKETAEEENDKEETESVKKPAKKVKKEE